MLEAEFESIANIGATLAIEDKDEIPSWPEFNALDESHIRLQRAQQLAEIALKHAFQIKDKNKRIQQRIQDLTTSTEQAEAAYAKASFIVKFKKNPDGSRLQKDNLTRLTDNMTEIMKQMIADMQMVKLLVAQEKKTGTSK